VAAGGRRNHGQQARNGSRRVRCCRGSNAPSALDRTGGFSANRATRKARYVVCQGWGDRRKHAEKPCRRAVPVQCAPGQTAGRTIKWPRRTSFVAQHDGDAPGTVRKADFVGAFEPGTQRQRLGQQIGCAREVGEAAEQCAQPPERGTRLDLVTHGLNTINATRSFAYAQMGSLPTGPAPRLRTEERLNRWAGYPQSRAWLLLGRFDNGFTWLTVRVPKPPLCRTKGTS
jgi:hypothetical protein